MSGLIYEKIPKVMASIGAIGKDRKNPQQGYQFRGIDDLYNACNSALAEHGVFSVPRVLNISREERTTKNGGALIYTILTVSYTFYATDGSNFECVTIGEAMDSGDKSCNKSMSAAQKYAFLQVFAIPTVEPKDTENDTHELASRGQQAQTQARSANGKQHATPAPAQTPAQSSNGAPTVRGVIEEVSIKQGVSPKTGKPYTNYQIKINGAWYGTFSETIGDAAQSCQGVEVILAYEADGKFNKALEIAPVPVQNAGACADDIPF